MSSLDSVTAKTAEAPKVMNEVSDFVKEIAEVIPNLHSAIIDLANEFDLVLRATDGEAPGQPNRPAESQLGTRLSDILGQLYGVKRMVNDIRDRSAL